MKKKIICIGIVSMLVLLGLVTVSTAEKIEAANDEKYIEEYKKLFENMKREYS